MSMDPIDQLLAELKAEHDQQTQSDSPSERSPSPADPLSPTVPPSLDALLSELEETTKRAVRSELSQRAPKPEPQLRPTQPVVKSPEKGKHTPLTSQGQKGRSQPDPLLSQLKSHYEEQDRAERQRKAQEQREAEWKRQQQEQEKQQRLKTLQTERRAALKQQATDWLQRLNPRSEEGLWFEEFACNYESRLEAALDYLEALQTVERESRKI